MTAEKILDYDKLVGAYSANLDVTLRGFRPAEEMLDTWVPDEDPIRSLANLVEAAQLCHSDSVAVRVSKQTLGFHSLEELKEKLASMGEVTLNHEDASIVFTVSNLQETASFRSVRPIYQHKLRTRLSDLRFKRALKSHDNQIPLRAVEEGYSLAWAVQQDSHIVTDAVFDGPARGPTAAALDGLCEILIGLPVQEARDHAVIKLEAFLRDENQPHPISGIVLPQNADPIFQLPRALVKRLYSDYLTSTNYKPVTNFFDPGCKPAWKSLSPDERQQRLTSVVTAHGDALGVHNGDLHVVECANPWAFTIRFGDRMTIPAKRKLALALERLVREECDPRLEVFCEEKKDLSKLRRQIEHIDHQEKAKK